MYITYIMKEKLVTLRIDEETLAKWDQFCNTRELSRSNLIRLAVNSLILSTSKEDMQTLIDTLLLNYTKGFSKRIVVELSDAMKKEFELLRAFLAEKNPTN